MAKSTSVIFRVTPEVKRAIQRAAKAQGRSVSNYLTSVAIQADGEIMKAYLADSDRDITKV